MHGFIFLEFQGPFACNISSTYRSIFGESAEKNVGIQQRYSYMHLVSLNEYRLIESL